MNQKLFTFLVVYCIFLNSMGDQFFRAPAADIHKTSTIALSWNFGYCVLTLLLYCMMIFLLLYFLAWPQWRMERSKREFFSSSVCAYRKRCVFMGDGEKIVIRNSSSSALTQISLTWKLNSDYRSVQAGTCRFFLLSARASGVLSIEFRDCVCVSAAVCQSIRGGW